MTVDQLEQRSAAPVVPPAMSPADYYDQLFDVRIARSEEDQRQAFALRYRVYCEETDFLPATANPGGIERDALDSRSVSILLVHRESQLCAGTVRIILPDQSAQYGGLPARICSPDMKAIRSDTMPVATTGEISRFTIAPEFRRRSGDTLYQQVYKTDADFGDMRRVIPYMALGLFAGMFEVVVEHGLTHLCAIIDPALLRMLRRLHLQFDAIGGLVDFHGPRQPVITDCHDLHACLKKMPPEHLRIVNRNGTLDY
ncbi:MAG: PEP-CTERM/exosortase system-associated acyltransferase [Pseudomonadota bacterium]